MYYVYILRQKNNRYYIGYSSDLKGRYKAHKNGYVPITRKYRPVRLVFYCAFVSRAKAASFEKYLKSSSGFAFRNKRLI